MLRLQPVKVATSSTDEEGILIFSRDRLVAVIVRLEAGVHGDRFAGKWNLEATFGTLPFPPDQVFDDVEDAQSWVESHLLGSMWQA
jgi:hypothetical protein